jgi:hypothetical protein
MRSGCGRTSPAAPTLDGQSSPSPLQSLALDADPSVALPSSPLVPHIARHIPVAPSAVDDLTTTVSLRRAEQGTDHCCRRAKAPAEPFQAPARIADVVSTLTPASPALRRKLLQSRPALLPREQRPTNREGPLARNKRLSPHASTLSFPGHRGKIFTLPHVPQSLGALADAGASLFKIRPNSAATIRSARVVS